MLNTQHRSWAQSERLSCSTAHTPLVGGAAGGASGDVPRYSAIFVVSIATTISNEKPTAISRVNSPEIRSAPPTISNIAIDVATVPGTGNPSLVKRPTPWFA